MPHHIIALGEILWDVFPDGPRFGGAPANFGCSASELAQANARVTMVSAVGDDGPGRDAFDALAARGVSTAAVQINDFPTGRVDVTLNSAGAASYRFAEDCAWDHLARSSDLQGLAGRCDAVCFGTLGQRGPQSRTTIQSFLQSTPDSALRILDVNIREPFVSDELILTSLSLANVLKLNDEELPVLARLCDLSGSDVDILRQMASRFALRCVALTRGPDGAVIVSQNGLSDLPGTRVDVVDTVGAGDAFTASMTLGLLDGYPPETINRNAMATAAYVCAQPGATTPFPIDIRNPTT